MVFVMGCNCRSTGGAGRGPKLGPGKLVSIQTRYRHKGGVLFGGWDGGVKNAVVSQLDTTLF